MKRPILTAVAVVTLAAPGAALAMNPTGRARVSGLEVASGEAPRAIRTVARNRVPRSRAQAWSSFVKATGHSWQSTWDTSTHVPHRIFGAGTPAPGAMASAAAAEAHARQMLARHVELLAPGARASDFRLMANRMAGTTRVVAFAQYAHGLRVVGGQVAFQYKNDRLFVIASEAFPDVVATERTAAPLVSDQAARDVARAWMLQDVARTAQTRAHVGTPVILPIVRGQHLEYRTVVETRVDTRSPIGDYSVYVDAHTGRAVARENHLRYGSGTVLYNVPVRYPAGGRANYPAPYLDVGTSSGNVSSDANGVVTWGDENPLPVTLGVDGALVTVLNDAGDPAVLSSTLSSGGQVVWDEHGDELTDAQLAAYVHAHVVKNYARSFAGSLDWLDEKLPITVNIDDQCNAFSDGESLNFFKSSSQCENTGRLADVVYHEFGHSLHNNSIIPGMGAFEGAFSEGLSDFLAASVTGDSGMGRGFFFDDEPLREIDPDGMEHRWPQDIGEVHYTGLIFAGAMWDLRKALIDEYGEEAGIATANRLFYAAVQTASDIPSTYVSILAEDDDDGDLSNGTPDICLINSTFGAHGLRDLGIDIAGLAAETPNPDGYPVTISLSGLFDACPGDAISKVVLTYNPAGHLADAESLTLEDLGENTFAGILPPMADSGVVEYSISVIFADGSSRLFPQNPADPRYQFYVGETVPLYCTDFETDPFQEGWTHGLSDGEDDDGADDWQWGTPAGIAGSDDPQSAYSGSHVIGNDLGGENFNGKYQSNKTNYALSPPISIDKYSDVRLQYRRWLSVEDGFFDHATIYVDQFIAWRNYDSEQGNNSTTHHRDGEWRFHDVALSPFITGDTFRLKFELDSDAGLEFGGWTIDDLCVVADAGSICGDGNLSGSEQCDDGPGNNDVMPGACRENCHLAGCGDGVRDEGEQCDDGNRDNDDGCGSTCKLEHGADCGFSVTGDRNSPTPGFFLVFAVMLLGALRIRQR